MSTLGWVDFSSTDREQVSKILAIYRLAFDQPRQEELLSNLLERKMSEDEIKAMTDALVINLAPLMQKKENKRR